MNRNVESHFAQLPHVDIERSILDMSHEVKTSFNAGRLIPFDWIEVLPGDTWRITSSKVVRAQTMLTPVMDNMYLDTYWFFVPSRLVWTHFEEFMGANKSSAWIPQVEYQIPSISSPEGGFELNTIADYMGYPAGAGVTWTNSDELRPSALPIRCYAKICEDWFRAETVSDPLNIPTGDGNQTGTNGDDYINDVANGGMPFKVAKFHDYFTSCLPSPLRADTPVTMGANPVVSANMMPVHTGQDLLEPTGIPMMLKAPNYAADVYGVPEYSSLNNVGAINAGVANLSQTTIFEDGKVKVQTSGPFYDPVNLYADPTDAISVSGVSFTINELRLAFQLQKFYEKAARAGSGRYIEILRAHFGVTSPDARLQRSEYLGGNRIPLNVHEVTNNAQSDKDFLGDLGAKSATSDIHDDVEWSSTEHGYIIGVMCVRTDHTYPQGMKRALMRRKFSDFYWPVFANLGRIVCRV